jgi:hypothetical protein
VTQARAELLADGGAAVLSGDFFRSRPFLRAEGVTHTLRIACPGVTVALPVILRTVPDSRLFDAVSPYGFPGGTVSGSGARPAPADIDWHETGLVSVFVRERIGGEPALAGSRTRALVQVHDPTRPRTIRDRLAEQIRQNARRGWQVHVIPGPDAADDAVASFAALYEQTMRRTGAAARYFFAPEYFRAILAFEQSWLLAADHGDLPAGAGAIAAFSDGILHYYLGGTADAALGESPFKNVAAAMLDLADQLGVPLNLGGGISPGDPLEGFKRGFANAELPFRTHDLVCDPREYERLAAGRDAGGFFPAYRTPDGPETRLRPASQPG